MWSHQAGVSEVMEAVPPPPPFRNLDFYPVSLYLGGDVHLSGTLPGNSKYIEILVVVKTNKMKLPMDLAA